MKKKSRGLGDTIEKITKATGIKKLVEFVAGEDCGCEDRKQKLNALFRYKTPQCFTEQQHDYLTKFYERNPSRVTHKEVAEINAIYNHVFFYKPKKEASSCGSCIMSTIKELYVYFEAYNESK
jgi:hypothetical protein